MKKIFTNFNTGKLLLAAAILGIVLVFSSCATKVPFQYSSVAPAARGNVKIKKDANNNYSIDIELTNLSEANRLVAPKSAYVVWMESDGHSAKNLGKIESNSSMMSKTLKASFEGVSAEKPTKIFITSEENGNTAYPSADIILTTTSF